MKRKKRASFGGGIILPQSLGGFQFIGRKKAHPELGSREGFGKTRSLCALRIETTFRLGLFASEGAFHLGDGGILQLADALPADSEVTPNFFEGEWLFAIQTEALIDDG